VTVEGAPPGYEIQNGGLGPVAQKLALATLCGVLFLTFLDNTIVSVGLRRVRPVLHLALDLSGALILADALVAWLTIHRSPGESFEV
jgi:hypothetical protein